MKTASFADTCPRFDKTASLPAPPIHATLYFNSTSRVGEPFFPRFDLGRAIIIGLPKKAVALPIQPRGPAGPRPGGSPGRARGRRRGRAREHPRRTRGPPRNAAGPGGRRRGEHRGGAGRVTFPGAAPFGDRIRPAQRGRRQFRVRCGGRPDSGPASAARARRPGTRRWYRS